MVEYNIKFMFFMGIYQLPDIIIQCAGSTARGPASKDYHKNCSTVRQVYLFSLQLNCN
ncbi:hypothetical protein Cpin_2408 [Chitinophaga pinensis DSM 2588]|uniref:Uncharacterized protein n=1 Tax=Chitinophaga pinensis (strain ATCC 43595 / DSM 2588 / LMG 13176 / NBRC 15968 / NCIMB 11800 / UQM 2034) TaxID=485918 RepID=A0A979GT51_CHIPD|nr:hypothetical protein Cpin_2408 [Chitinophaga pinensis DSM 2588]